MSAADVLVVRSGAAPAKARISTRFLASELKIIFGRRRNLAGLADVAIEADQVTALLGEVAVEKIVPNLVNACVPVLGFAVVQPSLEDVFVGLTGEGFDVSG